MISDQDANQGTCISKRPSYSDTSQLLQAI